VNALLRVAANFAQHPHVRVQQPQAQRRARDRGELLADTQPREDAEHLVICVHRPRLRVDVFPAVQHQCADSKLRKQGGGGDAGGPGANDHDRHIRRDPICCVHDNLAPPAR
jgi:hypothetical protein